MRWLAVTGDLAFNLLFAVLAFASLETASWTPFTVSEQAAEVRVLVQPSGAVTMDKNGVHRKLETNVLKDRTVVLYIKDEYPGVVADLVELKARLARAGVRAFREELAR
jgi:hypothetical protein